MAKILLSEYAAKHGKSKSTCLQKAARGYFQSAQKIGRQWFIEENEPYTDARIKTGKYVGFREKLKAGKL